MQRQEPLRAKEFQIAEIDDHSAAVPRLTDIFGEGARVRPVDVAVGADNGDRRHRPPSIEFCGVSPVEWSRSIGSHFGSIRFVEPGWIPVRSTRVAANLSEGLLRRRITAGAGLKAALCERRHCADHDPKEERRTGWPRRALAEHACFRSVSGPSLHCSPHPPSVRRAKHFRQRRQALQRLSSAGLPPVNAYFTLVSTSLTDGVDVRSARTREPKEEDESTWPTVWSAAR